MPSSWRTGSAGWQVLGETRGFSKRNRRYWHNGQPKWILVRPLVAKATEHLRAPFLPPVATKRKEAELSIDINQLPLEEEGGLDGVPSERP